MGLLACALVAHASGGAADPRPFSRRGLEMRTPIERTASYRLNGRVRPMLFWIGRDDIGEARITWRQHPSGRRALEFLVGTDPATAPRHINRWGYIVEELDGGAATMYGVMKESNERTLHEAEKNVERQDRISLFRAAHSTIAGVQIETTTMTLAAPAHQTYQDLDALLALEPVEPPRVRRTTITPGTHPGLLSALESLIRDSVESCQRPDDNAARSSPKVPYVYNQTMYDLVLVSCQLEPELRLESRVVENVIDARFRLRNRTTKNETRFRLAYGTSGELREVPLRAVFRPQWWMEVELELARLERSADMERKGAP